MEKGIYKHLLDRASDAMFLADARGRILYVNQRGCGLDWAYSVKSWWVCTPPIFIPLEAEEAVRQAFKDVQRLGYSLREDEVLTRDGRRIPVEVAGSKIDLPEEDGGPKVLILGVFRDLSTRRRLEAQRLDRERRQRETLVREVHHRIKNHLQGLLGLLEQHARSHPESGEALKVVMTQIGSIAQTHGLQSRSEQHELRLCELVQSICESVVGIMVIHQSAVAVRLSVDHPVVLSGG